VILDTSDGPLYYEVTDLVPPWGQPAETLVFCHGVATNADIWSQWLPLLAAHYRIVRLDTRGFGRSRPVRAGFAFSLERLADDIVAVAGAAGARRFHLVGESFGGTVGLSLAARADTPVLTLACVSTAHRGVTIQALREWRAFVGREGMEAWSLQMMDRRFHPGALERQQWDWFHGVQGSSDAGALLQIGDLLAHTDLTQLLPAIRLPTLLLTADGSPFVTVDISSAMQKLLPHCELAVIPHSRHGLPFSHARECADAVLAFLRRRR
jgi:3-oxoadipate enol-lactonase